MGRDRKIKGIKIRTFNNCMMILSCIFYVFLICTTAILSSKYQNLIKDTDEYIACEKNAAMVTQASDYLTGQVRLYVQNMDVKYMQAYFEEVDVTRRREKALEEMKQLESDESLLADLQAALQESNDLMKREIYAMKLISTANHYDSDMIPAEVKSCSLQADDLSPHSDEMIEKARNLVYDEAYQSAKENIYSHLSQFLNGVTGTMSQRQDDSVDMLGKTIANQRVLISILLVMNILTFVVITLMIVRPLKMYVECIKASNELEIIGSYECKYLALTYNDIYELNEANQMVLAHRAEHDTLTDTLNRAAYDRLRTLFKESSMPIALVILDVDQFKRINDSFGHETGDLVLKSAASLLQGSFRSADYVIRLGGDEFVIIMTDISFENGDVIKNKITQINDFLRNQQDGLPPISLSAGVAFSEQGFSDDLFMKADKALYQAKNSGRSTCCFYDEIDK